MKNFKLIELIQYNKYKLSEIQKIVKIQIPHLNFNWIKVKNSEIQNVMVE